MATDAFGSTVAKTLGRMIISKSNAVYVLDGYGVEANMLGHKIYDSAYSPLSTNPEKYYRFSDNTHRPTGGDVYFGENVATSFYEVRKDLNGKSLFVGDVKVNNVLDLTDINTLKSLNIDANKLTQSTAGLSREETDKVYQYTNEIANQAYYKGYSGIVYNSSRNTQSTNNAAVVLFSGRYDQKQITEILNYSLKGK